MFSSRIHIARSGRAGLALAVGFAFAVVPVAAEAAPIDLATAKPFVVLGGSTVTNTGPSVLNGDLGLAPGSAITGFGGAPDGTVTGATHISDAVAVQAQVDLTTAYNAAAAQPVTRNLSGIDLGGLTLTAGAYKFDSSAQLTGPLTLDAQGDPNAQFVFEIASTLTTASASSVLLINQASPCSVFWQVGSSATLGSSSAFQGNVMALTSISATTGATIIGRLLARNGAVTLQNNTFSKLPCDTASAPVGTTPVGTTPVGTAPVGTTPVGTTPTVPGASAPGPRIPTVTRNGSTSLRRLPHESCTAGFRGVVRGRLIKRVVFSLDGKRISTVTKRPFRVFVRAAPGKHRVSALVTFTDGTRAKRLTLGYRPCAAAVLRPRRGPSQFAG